MRFVCKLTNGGIKVPEGYREQFDKLVAYCEKNRNGFISVKLDKPFKPRSTGFRSSNHHLNGHVMQIIEYTGQNYLDTKDDIKWAAVKYDYPLHKSPTGREYPYHEDEIDDADCAKLIKAAHEIADFLGIKLKETEE